MYESRRQPKPQSMPARPRIGPTPTVRQASVAANAGQATGPLPIHDTRSLLNADLPKLNAGQRNTCETHRAPNRTGLPDALKTGIERLSGLSMDDVRVHFRSSEPARLGALAHARGTDIHIAPGEERHLPHEAWHVVQQTRGRVRPTIQIGKRASINDDPSLEREADVMGGFAARSGGAPVQRIASPLLRLPRPHFPVVVQAYKKARSDEGDLEMLSQSTKPSVTTDEGSQEFGYKQHKTASGGADFLVADDGSMAIQDTANEPKQFFAKSQVLQDANDNLKEIGSPVRLEKAGGTVRFGHQTLTAIKPDRAEGKDKEKFADFWHHVCIDLANHIMGNASFSKGEAVLQSGDHQASISIEPNAKEGGPPVDNLAAHLSELPEPEHPLAAETDPQRVIEAASSAMSRPKVPAPGKTYGEAIHAGKIGRPASRIGVNETARPNVGEGFATFSVSTGAAEAEDYTSGRKDIRKSAWGYHYAAVVAKSLDNKDYITLQNYRRDEKEGIVYDFLLKKYTAEIEPICETLKKKGKSDDQIKNDVYRYLTRNHAKASNEYENMNKVDRGEHKRAWFFRMHGSQSGQSFHEQQAATGDFANPLTLRVRRDTKGVLDRELNTIVASLQTSISWNPAQEIVAQLIKTTNRAFAEMRDTLTRAKLGEEQTAKAAISRLQAVRALYEAWCTNVFVPLMAKALRATKSDLPENPPATLADLKRQATDAAVPGLFSKLLDKPAQIASLKALAAAIENVPEQVV